jgi:hypothetical protein
VPTFLRWRDTIQQRIISAGPRNPNGGGFWNDFVNPNIYSGVNNVSATSYFNTGLGTFCFLDV